MRQVAALFVRADSVYKTLPGVDAWDIERDARKWPGGVPVVAHPPCRAWGVLRHFARPIPGERELGPWAVEQVRRWGGVLEHPHGSTLFAACGIGPTGDAHGWMLPIHQHCFGHRAKKPTLLYIVGCPSSQLPALPLALGEAPRVLFNKRGLRSGMPGFRTECEREEREHTPPALAEWLVDLARRCNPVEHRSAA